MNREDIIRLAIEHTIHGLKFDEDGLIRFAALVIANHPPQSFMTWQEGYEAGKQTEREACAKLCEDLDAWNMDDPASTAGKAIRARGQA